jgi:hypothetical protein
VATIPTFEALRSSSVTALAAGVATDVDIDTGGAKALTVSILNSGANPITALSVATIPVALAGNARAITTGDEPCTTLRLTLTSAVGSSATIEAVGQ